MKEVTVSGKSVNEAVAEALRSLNATKDQVNVEVLEEPKKGLLGFIGNKLAKVVVTVKSNPVQAAKDYLQTIVAKMGMNVEIEVVKKSERDYDFLLKGDKLAILIGKRGQTLNALQYLVNLIAHQSSELPIRIVLDAENYRLRRKESLERLAQRSADKVVKIGRPVKLEPMPPYERKVIHTFLHEHASVQTRSHGEEPNRSVVLEPKTKG
ncbi:RNA-binding cell elongation regulator Jag/EloR [Camelliibacillus cellulosilyticus]|uniref:RNA-binding protein KhpB n=1 Tax=Camelliibacillus cellulosilyticus TaxID=2174486 RepID=A0ABV9GR31_9BACL